MYQNSQLVPARSPFFNTGVEAALEMVGGYTLRFTFTRSNSLFLAVMGSSINLFGGQANFDNTFGEFIRRSQRCGSSRGVLPLPVLLAADASANTWNTPMNRTCILRWE